MRFEPRVEQLHQSNDKSSVTFIPGTWAHGWLNTVVKSRLAGRFSGAGLQDTGYWFDPNGEFAKELDTNDFNVYVMRWTERNSVPDRRSAAAVLSSHLAERTSGAPDAKHFVIAHSHGGNIATMAFAKLEKAANLKSIHFASLSTPFIWFYSRGLSSAMRFGLGLLFAISVLVSLFLAVLAGTLCLFLIPERFPPFPPVFSEHTWMEIVTAYRWLVGIGVLWLCSALLNMVIKFNDRIPAILSEAEQTSSSEIMSLLGSVLILQAPADEAWISLTIPAIAMWLNRSIGWVLSKAKVIAEFCLKAGLIVLGVVFLFVFIMYAVGPRFEPPVSVVSWFAGGIRPALYLVTIAPLLGVMYVVLALLGAMTLRCLGYGFVEGIALTLGTEAHVEHYPAGGIWLLYCPSKRLEGFHHSLYEYGEIRAILARWLKSRV